MTPKAFEISKATFTPRNTAFELSPLKPPWYAVVTVTRVSLVATDEACEFFKVVPGGQPPLTVGRLTKYVNIAPIQDGYTA
ncbi:hypothetical protein PENSUB_6725 [Penicillium subrubescens]|uniref:Uncharacterized protein n=1 Tax=Penicillium subrubescens TaxID=1316194 RepID=A0A1Q5TXP0_9EURO|nr:hypothetical protein PENSUB_6725 [Penicillium subrubescens]